MILCATFHNFYTIKKESLFLIIPRIELKSMAMMLCIIHVLLNL
jgi:hypothetical protein